MIIKSISLNNIRSYASPPPIELSTGVTLFAGDIGSGKSTILSSIEFALFGLGEIDGSYLLRHGERTGSVLLEFEVNGMPYKVYRSLVAGSKTVSQKEGYIVENGYRTQYSVTEMKNRILEILCFNEIPRPKTSSLIYRYAVYTPQEMMKEVLFQPVDRRLETLRRAFKIEDYSIVNNNVSIILDYLEDQRDILSNQTQDLPEKRSFLKELQKTLEEDRIILSRIKEDFEELKEQQRQSTLQIDELQDKKELVQKLQAELPLMEAAIKEKVSLLEEKQRRNGKLNDDISEINDAERLLHTIKPMYKEYENKKERIQQLEPTITEIQALTNEKNQLSIVIEKEKSHLT